MKISSCRSCGRWVSKIKSHVCIPNQVERFWGKVEKTDSCWLWVGSKFGNGYGDLRANGKNHVLAHRYSYEMSFGKIPDGLSVLHKCDVRSCVNPDHLFVGTQKENIADMMSKGRFVVGKRCRGEENAMSKLNINSVLEIRRLYKSMPDKILGNKFGVSAALVYAVATRRVWNWLP